MGGPEASPGSGGRLLVVDDDPDLLTFVEAALREEPVEIRTAGSGEEALTAVGEQEPELVLLDVRLPGMDGFEVFDVLRERRPGLPVVFMTSHTSMETAVDAMRAGASDYLTKPLRVEPLVQLVRRMLSTGEEGDDLPAGAEAGGELVGESPGMVKAYKLIGRAAATDVTVLVTGETGTGKELVARVVHRKSRRRDGPFQEVNCAAIPEGLLESELFGHEKGSFTGAHRRHVGSFERAEGGTLFLDEIGEMPLALQAKVLRALEQRVVERVGGEETILVDTRIVAASNRDLRAAVEVGEFREDLYYRLAVLEIPLPPLRSRGEDLRLLTDHFVRRLGPEVGRPVKRVASSVYDRLERHRWPGNVRELRNVLQRALVMGSGPVLLPDDLPELDGRRPGHAGGPPPPGPDLRSLCRRGASLKEVEGEYLRIALEEESWNLSRTAERLGVHRSTVRRKIRDFGLEEPED